MRVRVTDIRDHSVREVDLPQNSRDMTGWQSGALGWSIGQKGSGAAIEFDEPLGECRIGVFIASFQVVLWGIVKELPEVWLYPQVRATGSLVPFDPSHWLLLGREEMGRMAMGGGNIRLRLDQSPIRFGSYILESLREPEAATECCALCEEPLHAYFRVGSQQACPPCTEKFKQEMRAKLARYFWRALGAGLIATLLGSAIHRVLLSAANVSFGSILIGVLDGIAMRIASRESAAVRHRLTAVALTFVAGWTSMTFMSAVYLAVGMFAAWMLAGRNVRTEIHGPFQSKTA